MAHYSLVASSAFFLGPTLYGFYRGHRLLPTASLLSTASIIMLWIDPHSQEKRAFDLLICKSLGALYFFYGWSFIESPSIRLYGYINMLGTLTLYHKSCSLYPEPYWIPYHMMFHYMSALGQFIVIHSTPS